VADVWYYADNGEQKGPLSLRELIDVLESVPDLKSILVWRYGFEQWRPADQVREIGVELLRPPPLPEPEPKLVGVGGWLVLVALQQVVIPLRSGVLLGQYISSLDKTLVEKFPATFLGEAIINAGVFAFTIYTSVLFFRHSRKFPKFLIWEWILFAAMPFI
jgi:hypothetical protein